MISQMLGYTKDDVFATFVGLRPHTWLYVGDYMYVPMCVLLALAHV